MVLKFDNHSLYNVLSVFKRETKPLNLSTAYYRRNKINYAYFFIGLNP